MGHRPYHTAPPGRASPPFEKTIDTRTPSDPTANTVKVPGDAIAIIKIPGIRLDMVVVEGTDTESLKKGPGHYTGTAYPWQPHGRVAIAGHRTTYLHPFYNLNDMKDGDRVRDLPLPGHPGVRHVTVQYLGPWTRRKIRRSC